MPYAVACPRCQTVIVLESLGAFDCPTCTKAPVAAAPPQAPPLLPPEPLPPLPLPPPPEQPVAVIPAPAIVTQLPPLPPEPPRALPDPQPPPLEVDWSVAVTLPAAAMPARVANSLQQLIEAEMVDTPFPKPRSKPVRLQDREPAEGEGEDHDDYDSGERQRRRAFLERERVARRKVLTKLAAVAVLAIVTLFMVRAAINHINDVAEHNATIRNGR